MFSVCGGRTRGRFTGLLLGAAVAGLAASAQAAVISSVATGPFTNDSILMVPAGGYAVDFSGPAAGITTTGSSAGATSGVTFESVAATGSGVFTSSTPGASPDLTVSLVNGSGTNKIGGSGSYLSGSTIPTLSYAQNPTGGPTDANFGTVVGTGNYFSGGSGMLDITLNNLNIGDNYNMQLLLVDGRSTGGVASSGHDTSVYQNATDTSPIANVTVNYTDGTNIGGYMDLSFTADAASQSFFLQTYKANASAGGGNVQALVLQDASTPTPEPASLSVLAVGAAGFLARRRR